MEERERILSLFAKLYDGESWIDVPIRGTLARLSATQANQRSFPNCNTIWEIVHHLIEWKINVQQRLDGKVLETPSNNYFSPIVDSSEAAWKNTLRRFDAVHSQWLKFLANFDSSQYESLYPPNQMTYYEHILGVLQHDAYHLGQIVILAKQT